MKKKYVVQVPIETLEIYIVEAENEEEAKEMVGNGEAEQEVRDDIEPYLDPDTNNWKVQLEKDFREEWGDI